MSYKPIESYGVIGDMSSIALIGLDGGIDFFCFPQFDSPSVFAALLDDRRGGRFRIAPEFENARKDQLYVPDTNVLITRFMSEEGILEVEDFMPIGHEDMPSRIVRIIRSVRGEIPVQMECTPAFDYGRAEHKAMSPAPKQILFNAGEAGSLRLQTTFNMDCSDGAAVARFTLKTGDWACAILDCGCESAAESAIDQAAIDKLYKDTILFWRSWVAQITYKGRWRDIVNRSALVLKLMVSRKHGSIIAAPTFGLPEAPGGRRNWDYRYCWIRDSAFTVYALIRLGLKQEAISFMSWVEKLYKSSSEPTGQLQLMYRIDGSTNLKEEELGHFQGYESSAPVRVGNAASEQLQMDIYGELLDAVALANRHITKISHDAWVEVRKTAEYVCDNWKTPDAGIWEFRDESREFLHSHLMCWVAVDRALKIASKEALPGDFRRWIDVRGEIYRSIFDCFWDDKEKCFVQHRGAKAIDASVLLMPLVDFIGPHDPRWLSTLTAIEKRLACDALVKRYRLDEIDLKPIDSSQEGSFNACSFWYIACLARSGRTDDAWLLFNKMISYSNHLGLYAEETGEDGRQLGNYPQALTHLALINAVFAIEEAERPERAETE
jgi:pentatricopeptide repeat protein